MWVRHAVRIQLAVDIDGHEQVAHPRDIVGRKRALGFALLRQWIALAPPAARKRCVHQLQKMLALSSNFGCEVRLTHPLQCVTVQTVQSVVRHRHKHIRRIPVVKFRSANADDSAGVAVVDLMRPDRGLEDLCFVRLLKVLLEARMHLRGLFRQVPELDEAPGRRFRAY